MKISVTGKTKKTVAIVLSTCIVCGAVSGVAYSAGNNDVYENAANAATKAKMDGDKALAILQGETSTDASTTGKSTASTAEASTTSASKNETVYVMANAQGEVQDVIVSDELKNTSGKTSVTDSSCLSDIKNLKGSETYTKNSDGTITWNTQGNDIYYQGTTDRTLPVQVSVSFTLDGKKISADEIAGKSGKVVIHFDYLNDKSVTGDENVPFLVLTGMVLDNDSFKNITVSNGKIIDDGDRSIVAGFALPGVQDSLDLSSKASDIPDYVEVTADTENFTLDSTLTYASCDFANDIDVDKIDSLDDLTGELDQVSSAISQLVDGSSTLYDGLSTLLEKSGEMTNGIGSLYSGATELSTGLSALDSNSSSLKTGAYQVFSTLTAAAQTQLNAALTANGCSEVTLTPDNYATVLSGLLDQFSSGAYSQATAAAEAQVKTAVEAAVLEQVTAGVKETVKATVIEKGYTEEQAEAYLQSSQGISTVNSYVTEKMASDEIKETIVSNTAAKLASSEVQSQITSAVNNGLEGNASYSSIKSLKASIDSYAAFYSGLSAYTAGVSSAANGASQVAGGLGQLENGGESLITGVTQLRDGAMQLSDGMSEFSSKISSKLGNLSSSELAEVMPRITSMFEAAKSYNNYSGIADGTEGSVKFIIKTASIGD